MPDVLANDDFGRDDGIICDLCGGKTYLTYDQGHGLRSYDCEDCGDSFQVQFDSCEEDEYEEDEYCYDYDPYDIGQI